MYKIFLVIFVLPYIKADNYESNEKYIDLLPEEDKQEFLNRIARRILEEVNSPDIPNESQTEVNEEQLDAQNTYVNKIIKEESKILQNQRRDNDLRNDQNTNNKGDKNSDNQPHIDLTLRTRSKEERNDSEINEHFDTTNVNNNSELKVIPIMNDQENFKSNNNSAIKSSSVDIKAIHDKDITIEYKGMKNDSITMNDSNGTGNVTVVRRSYDDKLLSRTTIANYDPDSEENTSATEDETNVSNSTINPNHIDNDNSDDGIIWISTKKIYDSKSNENINPESAETISSGNLTTSTEDEEVTASSITNATLESEKNNQEITTLQIPENSSNLNESNNINKLNKHLYVRSRELKNFSNTTQPTINELSGLKTNDNVTDSVNRIVNETISETNMNYNDTKSNTSDTRSRYLVNNNKENITEVKLKDSQMSLRESYASRDPEIDMTLQKQNLKSNLKEYEVFEVTADKPPFVMKSNVEMKDTPYYVPVYNYDPNYAYYRPRSRFDPNADNKDENKKKNYETYKNSDEAVNNVMKKLQSNSPIIKSIFSGYNKREKDFYGNKPGTYILKKQNYNISDLTRPTKVNNLQNIYYNPNDYLDMDYYFGGADGNPLRNGNAEMDDVGERFPNTDEEDHPYHTIHGSDTIKDHIRAVRKLLYLKQEYGGRLPEINKNKYRKLKQSQSVDTTYNERDELRSRNEDNIAIDYYFGILPDDKASEAVTINKSNNNKLLRNPVKKKGLVTNAKYDQFNEMNIDNKINTKLDKGMQPVLEVLRDFLHLDNEALSRYNWLESTVDILAAIKKLLELMTRLQFGEYIYPKDLELIKYILYLYKSSVNTLKKGIPEQYDVKKDTIKRNKSLFPNNKWKKRIREPLKLWREVASFIRNGDVRQERVKLLYDFEDFLQNVLFSLRDFHDAIKHIAIITKYNNQKWYEDLKNIYIDNASNEKLLTLLLHVSVTKLLNCIEESATHGAEYSFMDYIRNNKQYVQRSKEEFLFVLNILHELRRLNMN